jgi:hypothetical protein
MKIGIVLPITVKEVTGPQLTEWARHKSVRHLQGVCSMNLSASTGIPR